MSLRLRWAKNGMCTQWRLRSAWASTQSDHSLRCRMKEAWVISYPFSAQRRLWSDWADGRIGGCPGWSESSLGAQSVCWFCHEVDQLLFFLLLTLDHSMDEDVFHSICSRYFLVFLFAKQNFSMVRVCEKIKKKWRKHTACKNSKFVHANLLTN